MQVQERFGWKRRPGPPDPRDYKFTSEKDPATLPAVVDLEPEMPPIYDQGNLGSCTANALAAIFQHALMVFGLKVFMPSRLFIYWGERDIEGTTSEDSGAYGKDGAEFMRKVGVAPESLWKYIISKFAKKPPASAFAKAKQATIKSWSRPDQTVDGIRLALASRKPIAFGFDVRESFRKCYSAPFVMPIPKDTEQELGGHETAIVGYDDNKKLFKIRNSWGASWGLRGHFFMPYELVTNNKWCDDFIVIDQV